MLCYHYEPFPTLQYHPRILPPSQRGRTEGIALPTERKIPDPAPYDRDVHDPREVLGPCLVSPEKPVRRRKSTTSPIPYRVSSH